MSWYIPDFWELGTPEEDNFLLNYLTGENRYVSAHNDPEIGQGEGIA
jgi:hypothetical protein